MKSNTGAHTIIIVDDSADDRYFLKRFFQKTKLPLVILETSSGVAGMELLLKSREELASLYPGFNGSVSIFLNARMPVMDGWEFIEELERRRGEIELRPNIVMMYSTPSSIRIAPKSKVSTVANNYIVKGSLTPEKLEQKIVFDQKQYKHPTVESSQSNYSPSYAL